MADVIVSERAHSNRMGRMQALPIWMTGPAFIASYLVLDWLSATVSTAPFGIAPWSPETGLLVAALLIFGKSFWPFIIVALALAGAIFQWPLPVAYHFLAPVIIGGGYTVAFAAVQQSKWKLDIRLHTLRDILILEATAIVSAITLAIAYVFLLWACDLLTPDNIGYNIFRYAIGDLIGISIVTPFVLMAANSGGFRRPTWESVLQGLSIVAALVFAFAFSGFPHFRLFNVIFFPIIWIALRHGLEGAAYGLLATQVGLMAALVLSGSQFAGITTYQALMLVLAFTGLAIGGLVTERRRFEQDLRLTQESVAQIFRRGSAVELATTIAHEINQPLTAISSYARLIQVYLETGEGGRPTAVEAASKMAAQVDRTGAVVKNLRDLIRLGRRQLSRQSVHLLVREALDLLDPNLQRAGITARIAIARDVRETLVDRLQIEQVLMNIISNAIDAITESHSSEKVIGIAAHNLDDKRVEIVIRDTGPGFPSDFDFNLSGLRSSAKTDGLGVGLSLSRTIVEGHEGELLLGGNTSGAIVRVRLKSAPSEARA